MLPEGETRFAEIDGDEIWPGIFFLKDEQRPAVHGARVGSLAFMIRADGLLATCAHVPLNMGARPGDDITLFSAACDISVQARVLKDGWSGPDPEQYFSGAVLAPEAWQSDIAFLMLLPETALADLARSEGRGEEAPRAVLEEAARFLPLGSPNYPLNSARPLRAHHVTFSDYNLPEKGTSTPTFVAAERKRDGGTVTLASDMIDTGDSGGPIWDCDRRRVVAMVRRRMLFQPHREFAADARSIAALSGVPTQIDADAKTIVKSLFAVAEATSLLRHFPILRSLAHGAFVELRAAPVADRDILADTAPIGEGPATWKILHTAVEQKGVFLLGGPGAGKSTVIYRISQMLLENHIVRDGKRILPLIYQAQDFQRYGLNLREMVATAARRADLRLTPEREPLEVLATNDLALMVLIDGLDEIETVPKIRLIQQATAKISASGLPDKGMHEAYNEDVFLVVASRPVDDLRILQGGLGPAAVQVLELQPLNEREIDSFVSGRVDKEDRRESLRQMINVLSWAQAGPTPLQMVVALEFADAAEMAEERLVRPVDLTFRLIDHLIALGEDEDRKKDTDGIGRSETHEILAENLRTLLRVVGENFIAGAISLEENCRQENFVVAGKGIASAEVRDFLRKERDLLGGILAFEPREDGESVLIWPHRTIPEALASEYHADICMKDYSTSFKTFRALSPQRSQGFELQFLSLIDARSCGDSADEYASTLISTKLEREHMHIETTYFALRVLASGIVVRDDVMVRLVNIVLKVLTSGTGDGRINDGWQVKCSTIFSMTAAPSPTAIAQLPSVRPYLISKLNGILERRARATGRARLTQREEALIEKLSLWNVLTVPTIAPRAPSGGRRAKRGPPVPSRPGDMWREDTGLPESTVVFDFALSLLARDPDAFVHAFAAFLETQQGDADSVEMLRQFLLQYSTSGRGKGDARPMRPSSEIH